MPRSIWQIWKSRAGSALRETEHPGPAGRTGNHHCWELGILEGWLGLERDGSGSQENRKQPKELEWGLNWRSEFGELQTGNEESWEMSTTSTNRTGKTSAGKWVRG